MKGDHAIGEHYIIAHNRSAQTDTLTGGRYIDSYERRSGQWRIAHRTFVCDWNMAHPTSYQSGGFYEALSQRGSYGQSDPVYAHWASF